MYSRHSIRLDITFSNKILGSSFSSSLSYVFFAWLIYVSFYFVQTPTVFGLVADMGTYIPMGWAVAKMLADDYEKYNFSLIVHAGLCILSFLFFSLI